MATNPALVTQRAAQPLPRVALWLFCAAYVVPGVFGRDPWKNADIAAFGYMANIASGASGWLSPTVGGLPPDAAVLSYWLGALFIKLLGGVIDPTLAARIPFALLLVAVMLLTWYACYHLARTDAAQPLPFAFGGEANPIDYARAIADGALLALVASLGLLQLGHETTPELAQLACVAWFVYGVAAPPTPWVKLSALAALPALAASGAPTVALALGVVATWLVRAADGPRGRAWVWVAAGTVAGVAAATALGAWGWRIKLAPIDGSDVWETIRLFVWFLWPAWLLGLWTVWRWRGHLSDRHLALPAGCAAVSMVACIAMGGSDRALMLALPPLAILAAFALPTLKRSAANAIDWFSVIFLTMFALFIWVVWIAQVTGFPPKTAANVARLVPGYVPQFSWFALVPALVASIAWLWLVRWRTGRSRDALWKSLVLPAGGVALSWLLVMSLLLPALDQARGYRSLIARVARVVPEGSCIAAPGVSRAQAAALEWYGRYQVDAVTPLADVRCPVLVQAETRNSPKPPKPIAGWRMVKREPRNARDDETLVIYRRSR